MALSEAGRDVGPFEWQHRLGIWPPRVGDAPKSNLDGAHRRDHRVRQDRHHRHQETVAAMTKTRTTRTRTMEYLVVVRVVKALRQGDGENDDELRRFATGT